jgi:hypothetical protein
MKKNKALRKFARMVRRGLKKFFLPRRQRRPQVDLKGSIALNIVRRLYSEVPDSRPVLEEVAGGKDKLARILEA